MLYVRYTMSIVNADAVIVSFTYLVLVSLDTTRVSARFSAFNLSFSALSFCNCCKQLND